MRIDKYWSFIVSTLLVEPIRPRRDWTVAFTAKTTRWTLSFLLKNEKTKKLKKMTIEFGREETQGV